MLKKVLAALLLISMCAASVGLFAGCQQKSSVDTIEVAVGSEPEYIDPGLNNAADSGVFIDQCFEGLTTVDRTGRLIPGVAKSWKISDDGLTYTFYLRDCLWSDGQPVRAQDFEYAWKRFLSPDLTSEYAYYGFYLLNGEEYNAGTKTADDVGVKALDDKTLQVTLKAPTAYFPDLLHYTCYYPVRKDIIDKYGSTWTQDPATYVCNGPYKMKQWEHDAWFDVEINPDYWNKSILKLKEIDFLLTDDDAAVLQEFETGKLAMDFNRMPSNEIPRLMQQGKAIILPDLASYYYDLNIKAPPLDNVKVRQALSMAIDRTYIVEKVTKAGQKPSAGFVPRGIPGQAAGKDFRSEAPVFLKPTADIAGAKKLLADAGFPDGKGFPELEITYNTSEGHKLVAEAVQAMWKQNLGISVKITEIEWTAFQDKRANKDYQIARDGWGASYEDAMTFMDVLSGDSGGNYTNWSDPGYDALIRKAQVSIDQKIRIPAMHDAEQILMNAAPIIPIYDYTVILLADKKLKDYYISPNGHICLQYAHMQ